MEKLKILIITQATWNPHFGAVKVHIDLKEEYERQGHEVDKISLDDFHPYGQNPFSKIFDKLYTEYIFEFLKKNAYKYDVIDANFSCVTYPKSTFGFKGVLLFRSHGIAPVYQWAEENIERYKQALASDYKKVTIKTRIGNLYRAVQKKAGIKEFNLSVSYADLVHCLNKAEYQYFVEKGVPKKKLLLLPNGIPDNIVSEMNLNSTESRENSICFIGAWSVRKGIKDLDYIISYIKGDVELKEVVLLGGQQSKNKIESFFKPENRHKLNIIPDFDKSELLGYIKKCKVGLFPSYVEGHPLAIIEQLSMGIPVISYRVPGSTDILEDLDDLLLVSPGDVIGFANKTIEVMKLDPKGYASLSEKCKAVSRRFLLSGVTQQFTANYNEYLG